METKIHEWLSSQGYPLEMFASRSFDRAGFNVIQSDYFEDPVTGDSRELDLRASVQATFGEMFLRVSLAIECKSTPGKPWILFTNPSRIADPARVAQRGYSKLAKSFLNSMAHNKSMQNLPAFQVPERTAYSVTQAFTTGQDVAYSAAMSVSKAAGAMLADADRHTSMGERYALVAFPVIVIDAPLVEAFLNDAGEMVVSTVDSGILIWRNPVMHNLLNCISIVRRDSVDAFASDMHSSFISILEFAKNEIPKHSFIVGDRDT
ncbi:hypothetical protein [Rubripirellula lacrimiformis]|nr:hypothetical protein [Rubripirellula lacrimiformis]